MDLSKKPTLEIYRNMLDILKILGLESDIIERRLKVAEKLTDNDHDGNRALMRLLESDRHKIEEQKKRRARPN